MFDPILLDKDFQYTSATALPTSEKGDIASLKCYLFEEGNYISDAEVRFNKMLIDKVSEDYDSSLQVPASPKELLEECIHQILPR